MEVTDRVASIVRDVNSGIKATKSLAEAIDENVKATKVLMKDTDANITKVSRALTKEVGDSVKLSGSPAAWQTT